jgi:hypothetical protein
MSGAVAPPQWPTGDEQNQDHEYVVKGLPKAYFFNEVGTLGQPNKRLI